MSRSSNEMILAGERVSVTRSGKGVQVVSNVPPMGAEIERIFTVSIWELREQGWYCLKDKQVGRDEVITVYERSIAWTAR